MKRVWEPDELLELEHLVATGRDYATIATKLGRSERSVANKAFKLRKVNPDWGNSDLVPQVDGEEYEGPIKTIEGRVTSLEELLAFFEVDEEEWLVRDWRANSWEQNSVKAGLVTLFQVRANLVPAVDPRHEKLAELVDGLIDKVSTFAPSYTEPIPEAPLQDRYTEEPVLLVPSLYDSHIGMRAWPAEVGQGYDSAIAEADYNKAFDGIVAPAAHYNVERSLYVVGHDMLHVDTLGEMGRGGKTTAGTPQDIDDRLDKMFDVALACAIRSIDRLMLYGPVDVVVVKGNHDTERISLLGRVLAAWYRKTDRVQVDFGPDTRKYYRWHSLLLGMTHGKEFKRNRDPLPLIMSQEADAKDWAETQHREWLCGHYHSEHELRWMSRQASRGVVVRVLPGLTADDAWHHKEGYRHRRAGEALIYGKTRGYLASYSYNVEVE